MASPRFLARSGHHHRRFAAYGLHAENHRSGVTRGETRPASSPKFPGFEFRGPFDMVRA